MPVTPVIFYQEADGTVPLLEWLDAINDRRAVVKCLAKVERLRELGHELRRPEADFLRDGIYELRIAFGHVNYRILFFFHGQSAAIVSHGLTKEAKVPAREINLAIARMKKFRANPDRHTYREG